MAITTSIAAGPVAVPMQPTPSRMSGFAEVQSQPLWFRLKLAAATLPALSKVDLFNKKKNEAPHLTNSEESQSMPNTCGYKVAAVELVPNASCDPTAFRALMNACRLVIEVGTKGIEQLNQPCAFFGASSRLSAVDNSASLQVGIFTLRDGEEVNLEPDQPFRVYLQLDDIGATLAQPVDMLIRFHGQKRGRVSLG